MESDKAWALWIGYIIISIVTVAFIVGWSGSPFILYFGIIFLVVSTIGTLFYLRGLAKNLLRCPKCKYEFKRNYWD